jgi:dTDP-glucose 4,6-dehydratase
VIPTIITQLANLRGAIKLGSLTPTRDFSYVADTVSGFIAALKSKEGIGEVFNLGSGFEISIGDVANMIGDIMSLPIQILTDAQRLRPDNSEVDRLWAENSRAKQTFGWSPQFTGLDGFKLGLSKTVDWFSEPDNLKAYKSGVYNL